MEKHKQDELKRLLATPRRITIVSHRQPDGDAIGSSLGLAHYLRTHGHRVTVVMPTDYPEFLKWMPGTADVLIHEENRKATEAAMQGTEVLFVLDFNAPSRAYLLENLLVEMDCVKVMIDHHISPEPFVHFMLSDTKACSTSELVVRFIRMMGHEVPNADSGKCLYCGILTDSGSFRFPNVTPETHRIVADLIELGVDHTEVYDHIFNNSTEEKLRLLGFCLDEKMVVMPKYHAAHISLSYAEKERFKFRPGDTEGTVNYPLGIAGIRLSAFFSEDKDRVKISLRSQGSFDVNLMARAHFNGGGHRNAAGGHSFESLEATVQRFEDLLPTYADQLRQP